MKLNKFVEELNKSNDKVKFLKKHIRREYVPYKEKVEGSERVIQSSMYKEINGVRKFAYNTPARYLLFIITIVTAYLDVEVDTENMLDEMDIIEENHVGDLLLAALPDVKVYQTVLNMAVDDVVSTENSLVVFLDNKIDALGLSLDAISSGFKEVLKEDV